MITYKLISDYLKESVENMNKELKEEILSERKINITTISSDLTKEENCINIHKKIKDVDLLINNAGFGDYGEFTQTSLEKELKMINTNITAVHILTKLYLIDMKKKNKGQILNVASIAGFMPGPLMSTYYATKNYVVRLSEGIREELKRENSSVKISILCPGPVSTNFEKNANIGFNFNGISSEYVARYALNHLNKFYIVPGFFIRVSRIIMKIIPSSIISKIIYSIQSKRKK